MSSLAAAFILVFALLPREETAQGAAGGHILSDDPELARAITKLRPKADRWTLRSPDGSIAHRGRAVFVDFPPHKTIGRVQLYHSFFCQERGEERRWRCARRSKKTLILVTPASDFVVGSQECPATVRGITALDGIDTKMVPDLADFLRSNPIGHEGAMSDLCGPSPPTCRISSIELLDSGKHKVYVTIDAFRWLEITMAVTCLGRECDFEPISCVELVT